MERGNEYCAAAEPTFRTECEPAGGIGGRRLRCSCRLDSEWKKCGGFGRRTRNCGRGQMRASGSGWLGIVDEQIAQSSYSGRLAAEVRAAKIQPCFLLLGMGGSSLCPEVMKLTFGKVAGFPEMFVLDSTDPAQVLATEAESGLAKTLFIVSSKSGSTLEPNIFHQYFYERAKQAVGAKGRPKRFIAITDPGSQLEKVAKAEGFRRIFPECRALADDIRRYRISGLSPRRCRELMWRVFGRAPDMVLSCGPDAPAGGIRA